MACTIYILAPDVLKIDEVKTYWKVSERPFYDEMNDDEKIEICKYSEDMGLPYEFIKFSRSTVQSPICINGKIYSLRSYCSRIREI